MTVATQTQTKTDRRTFTWRCWFNGELRDIVISPPAKEEKNLKQGGVRGRLYERNGSSLRTVSGVVHQDAEGRTYFVPSTTNQ